MRKPFPVLLALALALVLATEAGAQPGRRITVRGDDQSRAAEIVRQVLARNTYLLIDRDTVLPATFRAPADLVVADAEVRLEGAVEGSVAVVGGHLYLRPGARVGGPVGVIDGGFYPSARAAYDEVAESRASTTADVRLDSAALARGDTAGAALVAGLDPPPFKQRFAIVPKPAPTYDRVNGLTASVGFRLRLTRDYDDPPRLDGWVSYRSERGSWGGGARLHVPLRTAGLHLEAEASRATQTEDDWNAGDFWNGISAALTGRDFRDYYESDRATLFLTRPLETPLVAGETWLGPRAGVLVSRDRSLRTRDDLWALFNRDELRRPNPPIDSGTVVSAIAGAEVRLAGAFSFFTGDVQVERGLPAGDFEFTHLVADGQWEATVFRTHELQLHFRGMGTLGGDAPSPRQRWILLGGAGTLPTLEIGELRGDRLLFVESAYAIPFQRLEVPFLGIPALELSHATGTAWVTGTPMPGWVQNVAVGVRFPFFRARVVVDPGEAEIEPAYDIGITFAGL